VDKVNIHIKIKSHLPIQNIYLVKGEKRNYRCMEPNRKFLNIFLEDRIEEDTYYRLEVSHDKIYAPYCVSSLTNPIFIKKALGPSGGFFYFINDSQPIFDNRKKRLALNCTKLKKVKFANNIWQIELYEPSLKGRFFVFWNELKKVKIDGKECKLGKKGNIKIITFKKGNHKIIIVGKK
jgi:hypothetical protein